MDPFSITIGALGITEFAISSIEKLRDGIDGLVEAKDIIQDIAASLEDIQLPLAALAGLKIPDSVTYNAAKEDLEKTGLLPLRRLAIFSLNPSYPISQFCQCCTALHSLKMFCSSS